jgi:hypothetical protein
MHLMKIKQAVVVGCALAMHGTEPGQSSLCQLH